MTKKMELSTNACSVNIVAFERDMVVGVRVAGLSISETHWSTGIFMHKHL